MGTTFAETRTESLHAGIDHFVTKPFRVADLLARVKALLKVGQPKSEAERALAYGRELREILSSVR